MSPLFEQMFGNLARAVQSQKYTRAGGGAKRAAALKIIAARKQIRGTPEYKALASRCQKEVDALNAPYDMMNVGNWRYQSNPDILTGQCRIQQENFEVAGGGD